MMGYYAIALQSLTHLSAYLPDTLPLLLLLLLCSRTFFFLATVPLPTGKAVDDEEAEACLGNDLKFDEYDTEDSFRHSTSPQS